MVSPNLDPQDGSRDAPKIRRALLSWYDREKRTLPWRENRDPWGILISEVMLQQTRVETVIPYFARFLETFPTPNALADADEAAVLKLWAGLGYYRRARNLKRAAEQIAEEHEGRFPSDFTSILALPGVGRYTAGAVGSIAFELPVPVVDGNVARVLARLFTLDADLKDTRGTRILWSEAEALLDRSRPGDFNQALMELGSTVCVPSQPRCDDCPIATDCGARNEGSVAEYPIRRVKLAPIPVRLAALILRQGDCIAVVRRKEGTLMGGLYDVPTIHIGESDEAEAALRRWVEIHCDAEIDDVRLMGSVRHSITRHRIRVDVHSAILLRSNRSEQVREAPPRHSADHAVCPVPDDNGIQFLPERSLAELGFSSLGRKILRYVD